MSSFTRVTLSELMWGEYSKLDSSNLRGGLALELADMSQRDSTVSVWKISDPGAAEITWK